MIKQAQTTNSHASDAVAVSQDSIWAKKKEWKGKRTEEYTNKKNQQNKTKQTVDKQNGNRWQNLINIKSTLWNQPQANSSNSSSKVGLVKCPWAVLWNWTNLMTFSNVFFF